MELRSVRGGRCGYVRSRTVCVPSAETGAFHDFGACVEKAEPLFGGGGEIFGVCSKVYILSILTYEILTFDFIVAVWYNKCTK